MRCTTGKGGWVPPGSECPDDRDVGRLSMEVVREVGGHIADLMVFENLLPFRCEVLAALLGGHERGDDLGGVARAIDVQTDDGLRRASDSVAGGDERAHDEDADGGHAEDTPTRPPVDGSEERGRRDLDDEQVAGVESHQRCWYRQVIAAWYDGDSQAGKR